MQDTQLKQQAIHIVANHTVKNAEYKGEICVMTVIDAKGYPQSSVITPAKSDGLQTLWFCSNLDSAKVAFLKQNNRTNVCFSSTEYSISLVGEVEILTDAQTKKDMWYKGVEDYYQNGVTDPLYCVLKFTAQNYDFFIEGKRVRGTI